MKLKLLGVLLPTFVFMVFLNAQSQSNIDSLLKVYKALPNDTTKVNLLDDIFEYYLKIDTLEAKLFLNKQIEISEQINFINGLGRSNFNLGRYYEKLGKNAKAMTHYEISDGYYKDNSNVKGQGLAKYYMARLIGFEKDGYDKSLKMMEENIEFYRKVQDTSLLAYTLYDQGWNHLTKGNHKIALQKSLAALKNFKLLKNEIKVASTFFQLSAIECELKHEEEALQYAFEALEYYNQNGDNYSIQIGGIYNTMGIIYNQQKQYHRADSIFNKAFGLAKKANFKNLQKLVLFNHSESFADRKEYERALEKIETYIEIEKISKDNQLSSLSLLGKGSILVNLDRVYEAKKYLDKALEAAKIENVKPRIAKAYMNRAKANALLNNYRAAYNDHKNYTLWQDSIYNKTKSQQIEEMRAIFDTEKKEQQIARQETEINLLEERAKVSRLQKLLLGGGLGLSLVALGFGYYGFRQRNRRNQLEKEKVETELAFKKKELTTHALHLAKKNEILEQVKQKAKELKSTENVEKGYQTLVQTINFDQQDDKAWENFTQYFEAVHKDFAKQAMAKYPDITKNELRLMALMKMNLSSKEIANILNISSDGVKKARQRLRKKMDLSPDDSLETTVMAI
ncbi:tetratricopeptide repeat protein [Maribacter sp. 2307ULW6-5]|uniref:tetratricopeptide repeat protein n=1 Tax=Maribacter sp. 2307ULW6-5 TaxID=3386275 RepID=UPI0039BC3F8D